MQHKTEKEWEKLTASAKHPFLCLWKIAMDRNKGFPDNLWQQSDKHNGEITGEVWVCQISSAFQFRHCSDTASFKCGMPGKKTLLNHWSLSSFCHCTITFTQSSSVPHPVKNECLSGALAPWSMKIWIGRTHIQSTSLVHSWTHDLQWANKYSSLIMSTPHAEIHRIGGSPPSFTLLGQILVSLGTKDTSALKV